MSKYCLQVNINKYIIYFYNIGIWIFHVKMLALLFSKKFQNKKKTLNKCLCKNLKTCILANVVLQYFRILSQIHFMSFFISLLYMNNFVWKILINPFPSLFLVFICEGDIKKRFFNVSIFMWIFSGLALNTHFWFYLIWNMLSGLVIFNVATLLLFPFFKWRKFRVFLLFFVVATKKLLIF